MMTLIATRYKTPHGEIDLIMQDQYTLVAIEVKNRKYTDQMMDCLSQRQILRCLDSLLYAQNDSKLNIFGLFQDTRMDFVFTNNQEIYHVKNISMDM